MSIKFFKKLSPVTIALFVIAIICFIGYLQLENIVAALTVPLILIISGIVCQIKHIQNLTKKNAIYAITLIESYAKKCDPINKTPETCGSFRNDFYKNLRCLYDACTEKEDTPNPSNTNSRLIGVYAYQKLIAAYNLKNKIPAYIEQQINDDMQAAAILAKTGEMQSTAFIKWCKYQLSMLHENKDLVSEEAFAHLTDVFQQHIRSIEIILNKVKSTEYADTLSGSEFEQFSAVLLQKNGYSDVKVLGGSGDQGVDITAKKNEISYAIQCKCYSSNLGNTPVQEVNAGRQFYGCHVGVVLTNRYFTAGAKELAEKTGVLLWDRDELEKLMQAL